MTFNIESIEELKYRYKCNITKLGCRNTSFIPSLNIGHYFQHCAAVLLVKETTGEEKELPFPNHLFTYR